MNSIYEQKKYTAEQSSNEKEIALIASNKLVISHNHDNLQLFNHNNKLCFSIQITEQGIQLEINANQININAAEQVNIQSKKISLNASEQLSITSNGDMVQHVANDLLSETKGVHNNTAKIQNITASLGNVDIKANDDIRMDGERVLLNCD